MTPPLCFHGRSDCAYCGVGRPRDATKRKKPHAPVPDAARLNEIPRCPGCGHAAARRNAIGLYVQVCVGCQKRGVKAPSLGGTRRKNGL